MNKQNILFQTTDGLSDINPNNKNFTQSQFYKRNNKYKFHSNQLESGEITMLENQMFNNENVKIE